MMIKMISGIKSLAQRPVTFSAESVAFWSWNSILAPLSVQRLPVDNWGRFACVVCPLGISRQLSEVEIAQV